MQSENMYVDVKLLTLLNICIGITRSDDADVSRYCAGNSFVNCPNPSMSPLPWFVWGR